MSIGRALAVGATIALALAAILAAGIWSYTSAAAAQCSQVLGTLAYGDCQTGLVVHQAAGAVALMLGLLSILVTVLLIAFRGPR